MAYYPVCLEMAGRRCLVVGAGTVAERKVNGLLGAGARVTVVSPSATERLLDWARAGRIGMTLREYAADDLAGHSIVFAATDDGLVNAEVARDARAAGVLINAADDPAHCDFILPAVLTRGDLTVAVSTGGASPALARVVRDELGV
ncbi:MAG TPA: bifunctional precorrin-2 dehydrogenase/sirohydrochlorin ferrochelatase, partial [Methylomirabilota bacterium]|nr:bifunctional precorrin-2 dehydrogenase/sirohydrochlorin ferrochelatase [Methylomirabilota bacterium]